MITHCATSNSLGIGLPIEKQQRYGEIATRLSELGNQYSNNVLDATMGWTKLVTDEAELAGMPESALAAAKARPKQRAGRLPADAGYPKLPAGNDLLRQPGLA
ncbi:hypothetical protein ACVXHA_02525 [Escherichia coli]